jgi:hypothetical protein
MKQDERKKEWIGYLYVTTYTKDGRVYAQYSHFEGDNATQATKEHNGAMTFFWCQNNSGIVSDLYNHRGEVVRHGARKGQPRPATYDAVPMPADIAAKLREMS